MLPSICSDHNSANVYQVLAVMSEDSISFKYRMQENKDGVTTGGPWAGKDRLEL